MILLCRTSGLLVRSVPKGTAHRKVAVDPGHAHDALHVATGALNALHLTRVVGLMIGSEATICPGSWQTWLLSRYSMAFDHTTICPAQKDAAVTDIAHLVSGSLPA